MALRMWASSTANALKLSTAASRTPPPLSLSRNFSTVLEGLKYSRSHGWVKDEGAVATIGITDYAQMLLEEVGLVHVDVRPGGSVRQGAAFVTVESVKTLIDIASPISGEVVEVNSVLSEAPELVNESPYGKGWMIKVKPSNPSEMDSLMGPKEYRKFIGEREASK